MEDVDTNAISSMVLENAVFCLCSVCDEIYLFASADSLSGVERDSVCVDNMSTEIAFISGQCSKHSEAPCSGQIRAERVAKFVSSILGDFCWAYIANNKNEMQSIGFPLSKEHIKTLRTSHRRTETRLVVPELEDDGKSIYRRVLRLYKSIPVEF